MSQDHEYNAKKELFEAACRCWIAGVTLEEASKLVIDSYEDIRQAFEKLEKSIRPRVERV